MSVVTITISIFAPGELLDRSDVTLLNAGSGSFCLNDSAWEFPDFENAEVLVEARDAESFVESVRRA